MSLFYSVIILPFCDDVKNMRTSVLVWMRCAFLKRSSCES